MRKTLSLALLLLALPGCMGACLIAGTFNPMLVAFLDDVKVQNDTDETLYITPMSYWFKTWRTLPLHKGRTLPLPLLKQTDFEIRPHETKTFVYDGDDASADGVLVKTPDGRMLMDEDREKTNSNERVFRITSLNKLSSATQEQIAAAQSNRRLFLFYGLMFTAPAWLCCFVVRLFTPKANPPISG